MIQTAFLVTFVNGSHFGLTALQHFASKVWNMVPVKDLNEVKIFQIEQRECEYKLCLPYVRNVVYVNISNN